MNTNTIQLNIHSTSILARMQETQEIIDSLETRQALEGKPAVLESISKRLEIYRASMLELSQRLISSLN